MINDFEYYDEESYNKMINQKSEAEEIISWIIDNNCSLRQASDNLGYSVSKIHRVIHSYIKENYYEDYCTIVKILEYNKKYRFKPRKLWRNRDKYNSI